MVGSKVSCTLVKEDCTACACAISVETLITLVVNNGVIFVFFCPMNTINMCVVITPGVPVVPSVPGCQLGADVLRVPKYRENVRGEV